MTVEERVLDLMRSILERGYDGPPILAESSRLVVLDGHHRLEALRRLGAVLAPVALVDYFGGPVRLGSWRPGIAVSKLEVVERASRGELFPPKTTRHILPSPLPMVRLPLKRLGVEER